MPQNLSIAAFVLGAILLLVAIVGGGFKLFGAEIPSGISSGNRKAALIFGLIVLTLALLPERQKPEPSSPPPKVENQQDIRPSSPRPPDVADVYVHPTGSFERQGEVWVEYPPYASGQNHRFKEARRDSEFIYLYDETRYEEGDPVRVFYLRLPISGGMSEWSYPNPFQWQSLYPVTPKLH